jgi:hypothetical protein
MGGGGLKSFKVGVMQLLFLNNAQLQFLSHLNHLVQNQMCLLRHRHLIQYLQFHFQPQYLYTVVH